jgi:NTE family protein
LSTRAAAASAGTLLALLASLPAAAQDGTAAAQVTTPRPRIGLVLGGGGARGAAHVGVLEVLERLRVPVDCVAGTSMGALVAGAWAAGLSPDDMRRELAKADWNDMFQDNPDYADLNYRNKQLSRRFLPGSETGIKGLETMAPPGVVSGQKIKLFFNHLVRADSGERELQNLPLPVSMIATDIGTGERVVLREGSVTQAMRASMSVPGLMAPLEYRGRKLVDGGLVDNLPIAEVRERCGAEVVIAVNVGSRPLPPESIGGLLSIAEQAIALLTEQNVQASLALLRPADVFIEPELGSITAGDFARHAEAAQRGREAAETLAPRLQALALDEAAYALWRDSVAVGERAAPTVDEVQIAGLDRVNPAVVQRYVSLGSGDPLDTGTLNRDLLRVYGDGWYQSVDYTLLDQRGRKVLRLLPVEKSWGPDYVRLGVHLESSLSQGATFELRGAYQKTWLNTLGGELLATAALGTTTGLGVELHQPLDSAQRYFVAGKAGYWRERKDYFYLDQRIAEYRRASAGGEVSAGLNFSLLGQARLGWRETRITNELETGVDIAELLNGGRTTRSSGWLTALDMDQFDRLYFPRRGWAVNASLYGNDRDEYSRLDLQVQAAWPWQSWVLGTRASWVDSPRGRLPFNEAGELGGFLNLSAYARGQLVGDGVAYGHVRAERIIGNLPLGLRGDMRMGVALEAGRVGQPFAVQERNGWLDSLTVYLGGETPLGPAYLGLGAGRGGAANAYLFIGTP